MKRKKKTAEILTEIDRKELRQIVKSLIEELLQKIADFIKSILFIFSKLFDSICILEYFLGVEIWIEQNLIHEFIYE